MKLIKDSKLVCNKLNLRLGNPSSNQDNQGEKKKKRGTTIDNEQIINNQTYVFQYSHLMYKSTQESSKYENKLRIRCRR